MSATNDPVRLNGVEQLLTQRRLAKVAELAKLQADASIAELDAALDGSAVDSGLSAKAVQVREDLAAIDRAIEEARLARGTAIRNHWLVEADKKREQAAKLRAEVAKRQERTEMLPAAVHEWEGISYVPAPRPEYLALGTMLARPLIYGVDGATPRTAATVLEAEALEAEAAGLESRSVPQSGTVQGDSAQSLYEAVMADAFTIGPDLAAITAWVAEVEKRTETPWRVERLSDHLPADFSRVQKRYVLHWRNGVINAEYSDITLIEPELDPAHTHASPMGGCA